MPRRYGNGGLAGRRALIVVTAGDDAGSLGPRGISGDLDSLLFPLTHGILWYVGIEPLDLHVIHDADALDATAADRETDRLRQRLKTIHTEPPVRFRRRLIAYLMQSFEASRNDSVRRDTAPGTTRSFNKTLRHCSVDPTAGSRPSRGGRRPGRPARSCLRRGRR
ncbi:hypothetical protein J2S43_003415 [Catenuloplanes nepalensis]|uniref:Flavodoxin-like fold domain-containing protein n=1 Tax=Catenuloplanes nepalensis TaxID=587533 RepID=A0ABT9MTY5_9ACTN|nr:hypothetical protein [Catenuloplanes nepalensis]